VFNVVISDITMGKFPKPRAVHTPGSYRLPAKKTVAVTPSKKTPSKTTPVKTTPSKSPLHKTKKVGRPIAKKPRKPRKKIVEREGYRPEDLLEAVRLVREEGMTIKGAAMHLSESKLNVVPRKVVMNTVTVPAPLKLRYFIRY
jgi:hypothetical protein